MAQHPPDVLFVPAHVVPLIHPHRSIVTIHDVGYRYFPAAHPWRQRMYLDWSTAWNVRVAAHILADSPATQADLIRFYGADPAKITVAFPGRDASLHRVDDPAQIEMVKQYYGIREPYILYLGTLQPRKNLARLIQAFAHLLAQEPTFQLVLAGKKGWLYADLFAQVKRAGLENHVLFTGYVAESDKAALLSGAAVMAFPSLYEGFGFPVLEAFQCGTPLVCSNAAALPQVAGDAALLIDPTAVEEWAIQLRRAATNIDLRRMLVQRGYEQARRFSWEACAQAVWTACTSAPEAEK
jgi:glycosyltransferase involved in cell wall biosynthesis